MTTTGADTMGGPTAYGILVTSPAFEGERRLTDGRDEGGAWFSYNRDVAEAHAAERRADSAPGVDFRVVPLS